MKKIQLFPLFLLVFLLPYHGICTILHVPASYSSIQAGIDASANGDMVLVEPGTYYEHLNLNGKNIILCSKYFTTGNSAFTASTIIDGSNTGRVITIDQGENSSCQVIGFTIQHGNSSAEASLTYGGGVFISESSPQIINCIIKNNYAPENGGGIAVYGTTSAAKVMNSTIQNNTVDHSGGGVYMADCSVDAEVVNCIISLNLNTTTNSFNGGGGGVNLVHTGKLVNCLISGNSVPNGTVGGGGVYCDWGDFSGSQSIFVTGCTIANNTALTWGGTNYVVDGGEFRNCIIWGNTDNSSNPANYDGSSYVNCCTDPLPAGTGNISSDPLFINPASGNFRLLSGSPCFDAGDNAFNSQSFDLDGNPRIVNTTIDMGAYENSAGAGVSVQIGSGSDISEQLPIYSCYNYNYSQQIYLGSEITSGGGATGLISKIRFYYSGGATVFPNWNAWTVYLGNTFKTEFSGTADWVPVASMTQVFSGIIPDPVDGTWLEITLPTPFYYSGNNIVIAVDENAPDYDCTAQWGSFYTGAPRGLSYYDDSTNPDPASPPAGILNPDIDQVQFQINSDVGIVEGFVYEQPVCTVPIAGATVTTGAYSTTSDVSGHYQLILPAGTYYNLTAHFHDASQTISSVDVTAGNTTTQDFCLSPYFAPPVDLQASLSGPVLNDVHLTWLAPGSLPDQWIHWDNGTITGGLGYSGPYTFSVASRWPVSDIAPYGGKYLKKIRFVITEPTASYTLKVWKGNNASTLLLSQVVPDPIINDWNEVTLTTPILIDGSEEFWFGYEVVQTITSYPAGLGPGPAVAGKGDMINSGGGWFSMKEVWGWEFNWTLQGFVSYSPTDAPQQVLPMIQKTVEQPILKNPMSASQKPRFMQLGKTLTAPLPSGLSAARGIVPAPAKLSPDLPSSTLTGYNVYRDNIKIGDNIPDLSFDDPGLSKGGYEYEVSAQYEYGESVRIGPLHVDIYTCFPPTNLTVSNATLTTTTADLSWTPSLISTNLQWDIEWGVSGFTLGTGTTVFKNTTPGYSLLGLTAGTEYDFYINTYCSPTDTSVWVKKAFRTHYFDCQVGAVPEEELCGDNTNGCDLVPPAFETITCGETVCGSSWLHRSHRDSDWYAFTLTEPNDVTLTGNAEFTSFMGIGSAPCPSTLFYTSTTNSPGSNTPVTTQFGSAGTYYVNVAPAYAEQVVCDSLSHYWIKLTCNPCLSPTALDATNITPTSADLVWTSVASLWNIEWGPFGFTKGTGTTITGTASNPYHLSGLTMGLAYSYYVQSDCGGGATSNWTGPYSFTLPCPATALPYSENFTSQTVGIKPQCWQVLNYGGPANWIVDNLNTAGGVFPELVFNPYSPYFSGRSFLTSPVFNTTGQASLNLSFKQYINSSSSGSSCEIWTTSNGGASWQSLWSVSQNGTFGPVTTNLPISNPDVGSATFQFAFAVNGNSWDISTWQIDDISLTGVPQTGTLQGVVTNCSNPTLLQGVTVTAGTNTTTTNASGFYQFLNIPVATYSVGFSMSGYLPKSVPGVQVLNGGVTTRDTCLSLDGVPATAIVQNQTVQNGQTACYNATNSITVAGSGTTYTVETGGVVDMIAGQRIQYLPGTLVKHGGYLHGRIAPGGPWCIPVEASGVKVVEGEVEQYPVMDKSFFRVYPNPTTGAFTLEFTDGVQSVPVRVDIYGMRGERVLSEVITGDRKHEFTLSDRPAGFYFIKVAGGKSMETFKLVKTR